MAKFLSAAVKWSLKTPRFAVIATRFASQLCNGCGVPLQHEFPAALGYVPQEKWSDYETKLKRFDSREVEVSPIMPNVKMPTAADDGTFFAMNPDELVRYDKYVPLARPKAPVCLRCFDLRHYGRAPPSEETVINALAGLIPSNALLVCIVDIFDFPNSAHPSLGLLREGREVIVAANKADLLPCDLKKDRDRIRGWVRAVGAPHGIEPKDAIHLITAKLGWGVHRLLQTVYERCHKQGREAYIIGCANVGKSSIINSVLSSSSGDEPVTISPWPGTTLARIHFGLHIKKDHPFLVRETVSRKDEDVVSVIDTPGALKPGQISSLLHFDELCAINPTKTLLPVTFVLKPGQTLLMGGLARLDYLDGPGDAFVTLLMSNKVTTHVTRVDKAEAVYAAHAGSTLLTPPYGGPERMQNFPPLKEQEFTVTNEQGRLSEWDIVLGQLGWASLCARGTLKVRAFTPLGVGMHLRPALLPEAVLERGNRRRSRFDQRGRFDGR